MPTSEPPSTPVTPRATSAGRRYGRGPAIPVGAPKTISYFETPPMKNRARSPANRSDPAPVSAPTTCGYHCPPRRSSSGADHDNGSLNDAVVEM